MRAMFASTCIVITLQFVIPVTPTLLNFVCEMICSLLMSLSSQNLRALGGPPARSSTGAGVSVGGSEGRVRDVGQSTEGRGRSMEEMQLSNLQDRRVQL